MITVSIDQQGRLVLPRAIRERLGLPAGQEGRLRLWESADGVMIEAEPRQSRIDTGDDGMPVLHVAGLGPAGPVSCSSRPMRACAGSRSGSPRK